MTTAGEFFGLRAPSPYRPGDRVELVHTSDQHTKLRPGDKGTVRSVRAGTIHVDWDSGSNLGIVLEAGDRIRAHQPDGFIRAGEAAAEAAASIERLGAAIAADPQLEEEER